MSLSPVAATANYAQAVPGHNRWHPDIPAVAEVISGGSVRLQCQGRSATGEDDDPASDVVLCGPISILGAEPGDILVIDVLGVGSGERLDTAAHPGVIGCAPAIGVVAATAADVAGVLLGRILPGLADHRRIAAQAVRSVARGKEVARCAAGPLVTGSRVLLPVHARGAKLSAGDLHFPARSAGGGESGCRATAAPGWIDLRVNLTKRGMERFRVTAPMVLSEPAGP
ncbi:MAG TPA: acetamidase/formamidase family protein [Streptosporangiaceae bacterium]|nr:acetamidase/formamidase family protein [Streptosporangiaceae bacterium]